VGYRSSARKRPDGCIALMVSSERSSRPSDHEGLAHRRSEIGGKQNRTLSLGENPPPRLLLALTERGPGTSELADVGALAGGARRRSDVLPDTLNRRADVELRPQGTPTRPPGAPARTPQMSKSGKTACSPGRVMTRNRLAAMSATGATHGADPRAPPPHQGGRELKQTAGPSSQCESEAVSTTEMFEADSNTLNESFSALCRESLFERQGNSLALPPGQPTGIPGMRGFAAYPRMTRGGSGAKTD
jgi:hypothetical protein